MGKIVRRKTSAVADRSGSITGQSNPWRLELLIIHAAAAAGSASPTRIIPASDSEHRPRRGGVRLAYRDLSGER